MRCIRWYLLTGIACGLLPFTFSCGGGSSTGSGGSTNTSGTSTTANTAALSVNAGPSTVYAYTNGIFVSVEICEPGTSKCGTIPNVLLDTGSTGLRLLSAAVTAAGVTLTNVTSGGNTLANCVQYLDNSYNWGPVASADVKLAGESASSVPIQIIAGPEDSFPAAPSSCGGTANNTVDTLLANGILGVSFYQQDCGAACAPGTTINGGSYYTCTNSSCAVTTATLTQQLQNPVGMFATDNNGLILTLPSLNAAGAVSEAGTVTFGIGTQSNNALGSAAVLTPNNSGNFTTKFNTTTTPVGFIDSGSSALFFLDSATSGLAAICRSKNEMSANCLAVRPTCPPRRRAG